MDRVDFIQMMESISMIQVVLLKIEAGCLLLLVLQEAWYYELPKVIEGIKLANLVHWGHWVISVIAVTSIGAIDSTVEILYQF